MTVLYDDNMLHDMTGRSLFIQKSKVTHGFEFVVCISDSDDYRQVRKFRIKRVASAYLEEVARQLTYPMSTVIRMDNWEYPGEAIPISGDA